MPGVLSDQHNQSEAELSYSGQSILSHKSDTNVLNLDQERSPYNTPPPADQTTLLPHQIGTTHGTTVLMGGGNGDSNFNNLKDSLLIAHNNKAGQLESSDGVLDEHLMQQGLSNIGKMANGYSFVFLDLQLPAMNIKHIDILQTMTNLQNINLVHNKISDLSPLNSLSFILTLNVSNNVIESLDSLAGFANLRNLDASNNLLKNIGDMSRFPALEKLNLNNNQISDLEGLEQNSRLRSLDLSANQLTKVDIGPLAVLELYLATNQIESLSSIQNLDQLQVLDVSYNNVSHLSGLENRRHLLKVDAQNNRISEYDSLEPVFIGNRLLRELNLRNNPIQDKDDYRLAILYRCSELTSLDKHKVQPEEKVSALNLFNPPPEVVAARDHINHVVYRYLQPAKLRECTLPSLETPYPILVLSGPEGCGKIELASRLVQQFPDFFGYLPNHVLSNVADDRWSVYGQELQQNSVSGFSAEEFVNMIQEGRFMTTYSDGIRTMGIMYDVIDSIASEGLACVTHMEYEGILSFKKSFFEPRYLLLLPRNEQVHKDRLRSFYQMSDDEVNRVMGRRDLYVKVNQDRPGFFDQVIDSDDIQIALQTLTSIVKEYLGLPPDYVTTRDSSSGQGAGGGATTNKDSTKRGSLGATNIVNNVLRFKGSSGTKNQSGRQVLSIRDGMTEAELKSYERRESALREGIRENELSPESAYGATTTIYGKPYTAPAAFEGASGLTRDGVGAATSNDDEDPNVEERDQDGAETPLERPELGNESKIRLQERASALLDNEVLLENEVQILFNKAGKSVDGNIQNVQEAKKLIKEYFESNLFEFNFAEEDNKKFEVSFQSYAETDGELDMSFDEFKGWFVYMLRMIKYGLYADSST